MSVFIGDDYGWVCVITGLILGGLINCMKVGILPPLGPIKSRGGPKLLAVNYLNVMFCFTTGSSVLLFLQFLALNFGGHAVNNGFTLIELPTLEIPVSIGVWSSSLMSLSSHSHESSSFMSSSTLPLEMIGN